MLIIGLGNPGKKHEKTRHNAGFLAVDEFAKKNSFPDFNFSKKFNALISEKSLNQKLILAKPQTFMNGSGKAVKALLGFYKINPENLLVIHDDIDILSDKIKVSKDQGAAGHKGVESVISEIGTKNFWRIRLGILPKKGKPKNVESFVLQRFKKEDNLDKILEKTSEEIKKIAEI